MLSDFTMGKAEKSPLYVNLRLWKSSDNLWNLLNDWWVALYGPAQARSQVLRFGAKYLLKRQDSCLYHMFNTNFSGQNKILGSHPGCPRIYDLASTQLWRKADFFHFMQK